MSANKFTKSNSQKIIEAGAALDVRKASELTGRIVKAMAAALAAGETIELRGFGSLEVKERKATARRNPQTGEAVIVPPRRRVVFHPGQELKAALRGLPGAAPE
jgi:integration host factor subunit beta